MRLNKINLSKTSASILCAKNTDFVQLFLLLTNFQLSMELSWIGGKYFIVDIFFNIVYSKINMSFTMVDLFPNVFYSFYVYCIFFNIPAPFEGFISHNTFRLINVLCPFCWFLLLNVILLHNYCHLLAY